MSRHIDATREDFIEKIGLIGQAEGLPRIAGRIFGMLMFDGDVVSFSDLSAKLSVSRASISTSVRLLEERGLIKRTGKSGERQDYFQLAPDAYATMLQGAQRRSAIAKAEIDATIAELPAEMASHQRLVEYSNFYAAIDTGLATALTTLQSDGQ
ncbi:MAG: GbsR/MarR family transcriptional regulator [Planktomarina sp.]